MVSTTQPDEQTSDERTMSAEDLPSLAKSSGSHSDVDVTRRDVRIELAVAAAVIVLGAAFVIFGSQLRQGAIPDPVTTGGMPVGAGIFIILLGGISAYRAIAAWRRHERYLPSEGGNDEPGFPASWLRVVGFTVGCLVWAYLLPRISYAVTTPVFLSLGLRALGVRTWRKLVLVPIVFTAASWYMFGQVLSIRLPWGMFEPWARQMGLIL